MTQGVIWNVLRTVMTGSSAAGSFSGAYRNWRIQSMKIIALMLAVASAALAQGEKIRIIAFGAHPDDCDIRAAGTAALWAKLGDAVKFVSVTNGDAGHQTMHGSELAQRRAAEAKESARRLGDRVRSPEQP
jgi:GlcNAc-PI de-N-acetylase